MCVSNPKPEHLGKSVHAQEQPTHQRSLRCIPLMILYHHTIFFQKRSSGSQDIQIWKIEQSGWPRIFDVNNSITKVSQYNEKCCMLLHDKGHILINLHHLWRVQSAVSCFGQFWAGMARQGQTTHQVYFHHIPLMVLYQHAKNYQKRWSGSEDIQISIIKRYDWSRVLTL